MGLKARPWERVPGSAGVPAGVQLKKGRAEGASIEAGKARDYFIYCTPAGTPALPGTRSQVKKG